jgi:NitT/TauT family transport system substrate-binding protein
MERSKSFLFMAEVCLWVIASTFVFAFSAAAAETVDLSYRGTWVATAEMAPWHVGREKGFFAQEGINITMPEGKGSALNAKLVGAGTLNIAACDYGTMMKGVQQGLPIKGIFCYFQVSPMAIVFPADAPITDPKQLEGKRVACPPGSSLLQIFPALAKARGVDQSKIKMVMVPTSSMLPLLLKREVDALLIYFPNAVAELREKGMEAKYLTFSQYGVNVLSAGAIVNTSFMEKNSDLIKRFVRAAQKSWAYSLKNPQETALAFGKNFPQTSKQRNLDALRGDLTLVHTPASRGKPIGWMVKEDWENSQDQLIKAGLLKKKLSVEQYYTNEFISQ